jgi:hypothetical protein
MIKVRGSFKSMKVFILTFCRDLEAFYGTSLIFKTLRVGFPNARICVVDNASLPEAQDRLSVLCKENDCAFSIIAEPGVQHHEFIETTLRSEATTSTNDEPIVFLDPDICLWKSCEDFSFDGLIAGKKVGKFDDIITQTVTMPRIHSSFLWIENAKALFKEILRIKARRFDFLPFQPFSFTMDGNWYRYDTGAGLYAALPGKCSCFTDSHFDCYDHLYGGSHVDWLLHLYDDDCREIILKTHNLAKTNDINKLKGVWREQDRIFQNSFSSDIKITERNLQNDDEIGSVQ